MTQDQAVKSVEVTRCLNGLTNPEAMAVLAMCVAEVMYGCGNDAREAILENFIDNTVNAIGFFDAYPEAILPLKKAA